MPITFPTTLDTLTNPTATDQINVISHSGQHSDVNDAIEALEAKIGIDSSAVATSLDYLIKSQLNQSVKNTASPYFNALYLGGATGDIAISRVDGTNGGRFHFAPTGATESCQFELTPGASVNPAGTITTQILLYNVTGDNYERFGFSWYDNAVYFDITKLGTGSLRPFLFNMGTTRIYRISTTGKINFSGGQDDTALVNIGSASASGASAPTSISIANSYLHLGAREYNTNSYRLITFGWTTGAENNPPAYIGYQETDSSGVTMGDLIFGTKAVNTDTAPLERMRITTGGNVGIGTSTFGANAVTVLGIANGTAPSAHVDNSIQIYSVDTSDSTATLGLMLEQQVEDIGTFTASHKIKVLINGTAYWLQLDAV